MDCLRGILPTLAEFFLHEDCPATFFLLLAYSITALADVLIINFTEHLRHPVSCIFAKKYRVSE